MPVEVQVDALTENSDKHSYLRRISDGTTVAVVHDNSLEQQQSDSCSEESHSSLSRQPSDNIAKEIDKIDRESSISEKGNEQLLVQNIDFATRLGYSIKQLEIVLEKLGMNARQDQILDELIKFGPGLINRDSEVVKSKSPSKPTAELRSIVIDGSNIAMTYGRKEIFSCRGIRECVQFFRNRHHTDIIVFVPQFRREIARSDSPITDQYILYELEKENILIWTPSRHINGRRIVCHDDRYILKTAEEKDAIIVSNDEYRDLIKENPRYRKLVDERLLMYSFVDGKFMPPDDPLGRHGPKLAQFLTKGNQQFRSQVCPYARRCTYGNKCKYYHPERPNGIHISVTDRLIKEKQRQQFLSTYTSQPMTASHESMDYLAFAQRQCLNISNSKKTTIYNDKKPTWTSSNYHQKEATQSFLPFRPLQFSLPTIQQTITRFPQNLPLSLDWIDQSRNHTCLTLPNHSSKIMNPRPSLILMPITKYNSSTKNIPHNYYYNHTTIPTIYSHHSYADLAHPNGISPSKPTYSRMINERYQLQNILCQLFPERIVLTVMEAFPNERDPEKLCPLIIAELQKDHAHV
ncbi:Bifunctional endoribonuclease and deubiquitinase ZC3H12A [Dirofilaria immitis]|nr:Bifunctional endoribonuclease and deubiquitinase ZC3H12A [Dirofilaria immitis]